MPRVRPSSVGNLVVVAPPVGDREAAAAYVANMTGELATLVRRYHLDTLGYLLDMARLEAEQTAQR